MAGYLDHPADERLVGTHYLTSDVATRDPDGTFWYIGRADDVFKSSDYRISPFELESAQPSPAAAHALFRFSRQRLAPFTRDKTRSGGGAVT